MKVLVQAMTGSLLLSLTIGGSEGWAQAAVPVKGGQSVSQTLASIRSLLDSGKVTQPPFQSFSDTTATGQISSDGPFLGDIPSIGGQVTAFRFFTTDEEVPPPQSARQYADRFAKTTLKTVYYELTVQYTLDNAQSYVVSSTWFKGREPISRQDVPMTKPKDWTTSIRAYGYGNREPGKWEAGTYTVEIEVAGRKVASGSFVVY